MKKIILTLLLLAGTLNLYAQENADFLADNNPGYDSSTEFFEVPYKYRTPLKWTFTGIIAPVTLAFGIKAWDWGERHEPFSENEGWFSEDTGQGGADKVGHMYAHYVVQRIMFRTYDHIDTYKNEALIYSTVMSCVVGLMIEIGDAYTAAYGFSYEDLIMDYTGIAFGALLCHFPVADAFLGMTVSYIPTKAFIETSKGWTTALEWVNDYSGYKYMLNFKLAGFKAIGFNIPEFMRYIQLDLGYYTRNYSCFDHDAGNYDKSRNLYFGVSINYSEIVKDLYDDDNSVACRISQIPFKYYTIPTSLNYSKEL